MLKEVGLWIDHRKVVIVTIDNEIETILEIKSNMEKHVRFSDDTRSKVAQSHHGSNAEDMRDRKFGGHLDDYYEGVIALIRGADSIWIFGPGEAKIEFENCLKRNNLGERIVGVDTVDKMTDQQIAAKVRARFLR